MSYSQADHRLLLVCDTCGVKEAIRNRPFLLHVNCEARNPFWGQGQTSPLKAADMDARIDSVEVDHWEVGLLKEIATHVELAARSEMWYPEALLRSTFEYARGRKLRTLIALCGAQLSGKSVVATMSLFSDQVDQTRYADHYLYLPPFGISGNPALVFLNALHPLREMEKARQTPKDLVPASVRSRLNLKTVFFNLPERQIPESKTHKTHTKTRGVLALLSAALRNLRVALEPVGGSRDRNPQSRFHSISFYDTAGEQAQVGLDPVLQRIKNAADVVAVFVDPTDIKKFEGSPRAARPEDVSSITVAIEHILAARAAKIPCCVVVTMIDKLSLAAEEKGQWSTIRSDPGGERATLHGWLVASDAGRQRALASLISDLKTVRRVFFIWTENIHDPNKPTKAYGLHKLMEWCEAGFPDEPGN
jgi:hypothetical protein